MKKLANSIILLLCLACGLTSCENDGDLVYLDGFHSSDLMATATEVSLSVENSKAVVLSLAWKNPALLSSDASQPAPDGLLQTTLQVSSSEDFSNVSENSVNNLSKSYTGTELNTLAKNLGLESGKSAPLYFRIMSRQGKNMSPAYSNVCQVAVTPYTVVMNRMAVLDLAKTDTLGYLFSPEENGIYTGFVKVSSWQKCWFYENDGTIWGNYALEGHAFELSNASDAWNCWFGEDAGDWHVTVDTKEEVWSGVSVTSMKVNGESMEYDGKTGQWRLVVTTAEANSSIVVTADGLEYNTTTRDSKAAALATTLNFAMNEGKMALAETAQGTHIAEAGTYTIVISIGDDGQYAYEVKAGAETPEEPTVKFPTELCMSSVDGSTTLAVLSATGDGIYTGTYAPSEAWENFKLIDRENDVWYGSDPADQFSLSSDASAYNIWFNDDFTLGTTLTVTVDLNTMKWNYSK